MGAMRPLGSAPACRFRSQSVVFRYLFGYRMELGAPALDEAICPPGGIRGACRGKDVGGKPDLPLQIALVQAAGRGAVADDRRDACALGDALDLRGHDVFDARIRRPLDVALLDDVPKRYTLFEQQGPLCADGLFECGGRAVRSRFALVGRHVGVRRCGDDAPEAVLRVPVVEGVRAREHRGERSQYKNARVLVEYGIEPVGDMLIACHA